ncbi:unnamed protein product [Ilex paraguariensis]|uniref:GDSL esterase/lipase n=1 Tax=Ilex paraguariensis TaxID=185542 RepID=A0ABC8T9G7_9AQUA
MVPTLLFFTLLVQVCTVITRTCNGATLSKLSAIFIFGDSLLDTGNNNFIPTVMRANHLPYGQNFPGHVPTGRFSNGKLISDFMASSLGIKDTVPPFLDPRLSSNDIKTGVCFASSGAGFDYTTNAQFGIIPISRQPQYFRRYVEKLKGIVGVEEASRIINASLVLATGGGNDYIANYYASPTKRFQYTLTQYQDFLQQRIEDFVKALYNLGCRNMMIAGLPPLGDYVAVPYNQKLVARLQQLQESLPGSKLVHADIYTPWMDMIKNPWKYGKTSVLGRNLIIKMITFGVLNSESGFTVTNGGCCGLGFPSLVCSVLTPLCPDPSKFMFWDSVHPSESAYRYMSKYLEEHVIPQFSQA